ncbi:MAG: 2OG-Fe(II) oxygenase [Gammaproteobacteria bacterium]
MPAKNSLQHRPVGDYDWTGLGDGLLEQGYGRLPRLLSVAQCRQVSAYYDDPAIAFRKRINMASHGFGRGEYKYFAYPLPDPVQALRKSLYPPLARIANQWNRHLRMEGNWPKTLPGFLRRCHQAEQRRPTPLMLSYQAGDYNCLHQDLYGEVYFPFQVIVLLSKPGRDFLGGELVLVEQRPRMQSRPQVVPMEQGDGIVIPVREKPRMGNRGYHRTQMRHGVSEIGKGGRLTLGIIFHDAA